MIVHSVQGFPIVIRQGPQSMIKLGLKQIRRLLLLLIVTYFCVPALATEALQQTQRDLSDIAQAGKKIQERLKKSSIDQQQIEQEIHSLDQELGKLHKNMRAVALQRADLENSLLRLGNEDQHIQKDVQKQYQGLKQQLRLHYLDNQLSQWKLALAQIDPAYSGRDRIIYRYIEEARDQELKQLALLSKKIADKIDVFNEKRTDLQVILIGQQQQTEILQLARTEKSDAKVALTQYIASDQRLLEAQSKAQHALQKLLKKLRRESLPDQQFAKQRGKLSWPLKGRLENQFGQMRQQQSNQLKWEGVTIRSVRGKQVHAIFHGKVVFSNWFKGYGWLMIIDHGEGYMSLYAHAEGLYKEVGEMVEENEVIAMVGDFGASKEANIYFEIRQKGQPLNPQKWCS